jgi:2-keto-4-pentenoate hydratase/2-oxohepta-3-ene-1,7-dioic acid hydratase in catechol pathway
MKLIRFGDRGKEKPGLLLQDGTRVDVSAAVTDYNEEFFATDGLEKLRQWLEQNTGNLPRVTSSLRLGASVCRPSKIVCIGLNYRDHAAETGQEVPKEPVIFFKASSSLAGPNDNVVIPKGSTKLDWEVELAFVIGKEARYVARQNALDHVAGYVLHNDYSERAFQLERGGQWVKGKSADTFAPLGPFLATRDEIPDPGHLDLWLKVNGQTRQSSNTEQMVFGVADLVTYVSQFMTLLPGDVISTGTPPGVALGMKPPVYLKPADVVALGIQGLGESQQEVVAYQE